MVKAGPATDATIDSLLPLLDDDDILIDGGNTNYQDTIRRNKALAESGINFIEWVFLVVKSSVNWSIFNAWWSTRSLQQSK